MAGVEVNSLVARLATAAPIEVQKVENKIGHKKGDSRTQIL
jgi:hypothetical protein